VKDFHSFLKTKIFFKHFGLALVSLVTLLFLSFKMLSVYTDHGETVEVPDFKGKRINELKQFIEDKSVRYEIIDSIYSPGEKAGIVIKQDPLPKVSVKHNRTIYLYVTSVLPPQIQMPKLVDLSVRQALALIESYELQVGKVTKVSGECNGCVLKQFIDGKEISPGSPVKKGTKISLVIGQGESDDRVVVPGLIGLNLEDALQKLNNNGLTYGGIILDSPSKDSLRMTVYKQEPSASADATIRIGSSVILYITNDKSKLDSK
jgi:beta-lactam-binding protein with PASTA domain